MNPDGRITVLNAMMMVGMRRGLDSQQPHAMLDNSPMMIPTLYFLAC